MTSTVTKDPWRGIVFRVVASALGEIVQRVELVIGQGDSNTVFFVTTGNGERVVRLSAAPNAFEIYRKEAWCLAATADLIPGPRVLGLGKDDNVAFMIQTRILGRLASTLPGSRDEIWRRLGEYAACLESIPVAGIGFVLAESGNGVFRDAWIDTIDWYVDYLFDDDLLVRLGALSSAQVARARESIARLASWTFAPRLNHGNLALKNAIVDDDGVVHVIDWGTAESTRGPHFDIADVATWEDDHTVAAFLEGAGIRPAEWTRMKADVDALVLRRALDSVRWLHDRNHPSAAQHATIARSHADRILGR